MSGKIYTLDEIKQNLKKILEGSEVNKVILFGSYAKNKATKKSDLDFIIDSKGKIMGFKLFSLIKSSQINLIFPHPVVKINFISNIAIIEIVFSNFFILFLFL